MDNASLRPLEISPFACGMPQQDSFWWVRLLDTPIQSFLPYSHRTGSALLRPREITQIVCGDAARREVLVATSTGHTGKVNSICFLARWAACCLSLLRSHDSRVGCRNGLPWQAHLLNTQTGSFLLHFHRTDSTLPQLRDSGVGFCNREDCSGPSYWTH
jgi:hypothetical protein